MGLDVQASTPTYTLATRTSTRTSPQERGSTSAASKGPRPGIVEFEDMLCEHPSRSGGDPSVMEADSGVASSRPSERDQLFAFPRAGTEDTVR